ARRGPPSCCSCAYQQAELLPEGRQRMVDVELAGLARVQHHHLCAAIRGVPAILAAAADASVGTTAAHLAARGPGRWLNMIAARAHQLVRPAFTSRAYPHGQPP